MTVSTLIKKLHRYKPDAKVAFDIKQWNKDCEEDDGLSEGCSTTEIEDIRQDEFGWVVLS